MARKIPSIILVILMGNNSHCSTLFMPDSDTAIMLEMLATELEATAATLKILELSSEAVETAQDVHFFVDDKYTRAIQVENYIQRTQNFPKEINDLKSMSDIRNKARDGRDIFDDRDIIGLDQVSSKKKTISNYNNKLDKADEINDSNVDKIKADKKLTNNLLKNANGLETTAQGSVVGAKASVLSSAKLDDLNQSLALQNSLLINHQKYEVKKDQEKMFSEFTKMKHWGLISQKMTFQEYINTKEKGSGL